MATNVFGIKPAHDGARISLRGDMAVSFDEAVTNKFSIGFLTSTSEMFSFNSTEFQFRNLAGNLVNGLVMGGRPGLFMELMFDPTAKVWYITANNMISGTAAGSSNDAETPLTFLALPSATPIDFSKGKNFRGKLTANARLQNPINMKPGDRLTILVEQDEVGGRTLTYESAYGFPEAVPFTLSTIAGQVDVIECYMTNDYTLFCDLRKNYSVIKPLAYTSDFHYNMNDAYVKAQLDPVDGQTVQVIRNGWRSESSGTIGYQIPRKMNLRLRGVRRANGTFPELRLDKSDRPAFGKALVNIEGGANVVVEDLTVAGASAYADGNGTGILINPGVDYVLIKNVHLIENENGVRSAISKNPKFDMINVLLERNGWAANPAHRGQSHSIYVGEGKIWRAKECTFYNPTDGHNIKTRNEVTVLNQVYARKSNSGREIDCPDMGVIHATDCVFWKEDGAAQNNLIGIGHEALQGLSRTQQYIFRNCYFHNDVNPTREVTYLENRKKDPNTNDVAVHFIDCEFGGRANEKTGTRSTLFQGPYTITLTGGPLGPRVPVGDPRMRFNTSQLDPKRVTNPLGIALTPIEQLPIPMETEPTPPYPTFVEPVPAIPPLPSLGAQPGTEGPDVTAPEVTLVSSATNVTAVGSVTFTARATDNKGIKHVQFYRNGTLLVTDTSMPYTVIENYSHLDNGTVTYKVVAVDFADNQATSTDLTITVNIPAPIEKPLTRLDTTTQAAYDAAIGSATAGNARMAAANALVTAMNPAHSLHVFRNGVKVIEVAYTGSCVVMDDGYDIAVRPSLTIASGGILVSADLSSGNWWFELRGGSAGTAVIAGTVGLVGSGAELEFSENPQVGQGIQLDPRFVIPRSLDGISA